MANHNQNLSFIHSSSSPKSSAIFKSDSLAVNISKNLQTFYENGHFVDIALIAKLDNMKIKAHKVVLSASSNYFLAMFSNSWNEANADEVEIQEVDGPTLKLVLDFMYTASIELRSETVEAVLKTADLLQMTTLIEACCDFIEERIDATNCIGITLFADLHCYSKLRDASFMYALKHFDNVCLEKEFLQLSKEWLYKIMSNDLSLPSEEALFLGLIEWIKYDKVNREQLTLSLLCYIRFELLDPKLILKNRRFICKTVKCYELICRWLEWHFSDSEALTYNMKSGKATRLAFSSGENTSMFKIQTLNLGSNTWAFEELPYPAIKREDFRTTIINRNCFIVGGKINNIDTNIVQCLDIQTKEWAELSPMQVARSLPAIAVYKGDLYVLGGYIGKNWSNVVEKYEFSTREWHQLAPLHSKFNTVQAAVLDGFLYAAGEGTSPIEVYDPMDNKWTQIALKNEKSNFFGIAGVNGHLYAVGGCYQGLASATVERYHPSTDSWTTMRSLPLGLYHITCTTLNDRLIACTGFDGSKTLALVYEYNPETDEWTSLPPLSPHCISYLSSGVFAM